MHSRHLTNTKLPQKFRLETSNALEHWAFQKESEFREHDAQILTEIANAGGFPKENEPSVVQLFDEIFDNDTQLPEFLDF